VNWSALTPASREIVSLVVFRLTAGMSVAEIARELEREREKIRFNELPRNGRSISNGWVTSRLRDFRRDIEATTTDAS